MRNALARIPQSNLPQSVKDKATAAARRLLSNAGGSPSGAEKGVEMDSNVIAAKLGLSEDASEDQILAAIEEQQKKKPEVPARGSADLAKTDTEVLKALDLPEDASSEEILHAIVDMKQTIAITESFDKGVLEVLAKTTAKELENERELARLHREDAKKRHERDREDLLARAVEEGRILPVHKPMMRAVYEVDADKCKAMLRESPRHSFAAIGSGEGLNDEPRPEPRPVTDKRGRVVATVEDPEWLDRQAQKILAEQNITLAKATAEQYKDALALAAQRAENGQ